MNLSYKNITIRDATPTDAPCLAGWWNDGAVMAHAGFPNGLGISEDEIRDELKKDSDDARCLILLADNIPIGEMNYRKPSSRIAEIGIKICDPAYQEKGIGRMALSMLITALFDMNVEKIVLDTNLKNHRAQHVYEKIGFRRTYIHYNSWRNQLGELESSVDYALVRDDFHNFAV